MKRILVFFCAALLVSASSKDDSRKSFNLKKFEKSFVYIPMGSFMFEDSASQYMPGKKKGEGGKMVSLSGFYLCNHEVTNAEYREFLTEIKTDTSLYRKMLPDTNVWSSPHFKNEAYVKYYFQHPAYEDYPVVGITHAQAEGYCKWLTQKYMSDPKRSYKKVKFMLPNIYQWEYAAMGGLAAPRYPWEGDYVTGQNGNLKARFRYVCQSAMKKELIYTKDSAGNYKEVTKLVASPDFEFPSVAPSGENVYQTTAPVTAYKPNGYGLYNMAGNVSEFVSEYGITKGGSWKDYGYYLMNCVEQTYDSTNEASDDRGFRVEMWQER